MIIFEGVESAHSGEALLPDVSSSGGGSRTTPKQKKNRRDENTPLIRGGRNRNRSDYEDLDDETFNNWPSKYIPPHSSVTLRCLELPTNLF